MTRFAILLGGDLTPTERLLGQVSGCRCIAADSGMAHAEALQLAPELWVGDFDSAGTELAQAFSHVPRLVFPENKNATDGELAVEEALKRGASALVLVGGFGGQLDHTLGHMTLLLGLAARGIDAFTTSGHEEAYPLIAHVELDALRPGTRVSVAGFTDLQGLSISGVRWPLQNRDVRLGSSLTLSNECVGPVSISLRGGRAIVLVYP
jgi:thiamine pyrophosphokinase